MSRSLAFAVITVTVVRIVAQCSISNIFGSHMVLQRDSDATILNGFGKSGDTVTVALDGKDLDPVTVTSEGIWRTLLPSTPAGGPHTLTASCSSAGSVTLDDVLFGDVFLCGGQSNMVFTVHSEFNSTVEIARADNYPNIRVFTVGEGGTTSATPLEQLGSIKQPWSVASAATIGVGDWVAFSAVCWHFGRNIFDALGKTVPIGLVSSNWGGTRIEAWSNNATLAKCGAHANIGILDNGSQGVRSEVAPQPSHVDQPDPNTATVLYNSMIFPYTIGPMAFHGITWFQGESNGGEATLYKCLAPALASQWKAELSPSGTEAAGPWMGFVLLEPFIGGCGPEFRDAQLAMLTVNYTGYANAVDIGDPTSPFVSYHPRAKQVVGARLFAVAWNQVYGKPQPWRSPVVLSAVGSTSGGVMVVTVTFTGGDTGPLVIKQRAYEDVCPTSAGVAANSCGWPGITASNGALVNATLSLSADASQLIFTAPAPPGATPVGVEYAYNTWPVVLVYGTATVSTGYETLDFPLNGFKTAVTPAFVPE